MYTVIVPPKVDVDQIARHLCFAGQLARSMPPAWDGAAIRHPVRGVGGEWGGWILPGRGLYVDLDLDRLGLTKQLPFVYERTITHKLIELLRSERGAISTYDGIIAGRAGGKGQDVAIGKASFTTVSGSWSSLYRASGTPEAGTYSNIPGGAVHDRESAGAWSQALSNPSGGDTKYLLTFGFGSANQINWAILADLLVACGNISASSTSNQDIDSTALTRYTTGVGVVMTFEITTQLGTGTGAMATGGITYTNQDGTGSRNITGAWASPANGIVQRIMPTTIGPWSQLQSGDYGVRSVEDFQLSTAHNAGVLALNLYYPLDFVPGVGANSYTERDSTTQIDGLKALATESGGDLGCLTAYILAGTTSTGAVQAFFRTVAG